ncbi:MAG: Gfo/Idh/MocA family oxidoreductase [Ahrensia sp.]|nr:Gfo/Idh/MocA family oxidoreductase [Ahrensia sp.]
MTRLRVAVAGTGYFSQFHVDAWSRCEEVEIVGICGLEADTVARIAAVLRVPAFADAGEMLDAVKPDLLDIITPPDTHVSLIETAASRDVNVVCQKPFCGSLDRATAAVETARNADITLIVHENFRFQPWYQEIVRQIESDRLGELFQATFRLRPGDGQGVDAYRDRQPYFRNMPRFLIHETVVHFIDAFRFLFGEPQSVFADLRRLNPSIVGEDAGLVVLSFQNGLRGLIDGNRLASHMAENPRRTMGEMLVEGEKGSLSLNGDAALEFRSHAAQETQRVDYDWDDVGFGGDCVYRFTRHVVDHFCHGAALQTEAEAYLANLRIVEAIYESASQRRVVDLT